MLIRYQPVAPDTKNTSACTERHESTTYSLTLYKDSCDPSLTQARTQPWCEIWRGQYVGEVTLDL